MSEEYKYSLEMIYGHIVVCEKRFSEIEKASDFIANDYGSILLDSISIRLLAMGEIIKRILKHDVNLIEKYPSIEWDNIIQFRDFIAHHYEKLNYEVVFDICKTDLPKLKEVIEAELNY